MAQNLTKAQRSILKRAATALDVFINCPFDAEYKAIFNAIVYTVVRSGYRARCALETDDAAENRFGKIIKIISECRYGVHDISRTEVSGNPPLPRFNMPLELGLWFGAHHLGRDDQAGKKCIVFDREQYRYLRFISDISGQDIHSHDGDIPKLISELSAWLRHLPGGVHAGGGQAILGEYETFRSLLPVLSGQKNMAPDELLFADFNLMITEYVASLTEETPAPVDPVVAVA
ncbi:hypothetical protein [Hansschlegelia plantiphila]|uniref:Uncharacterized protein n=1 Tax=Hansschlegelia plantiphila TaxID=374655 RepID=A0A9W6MUT2_9HYPH|nr:hypothetical protein [Hansschlegelia plantiphila]GLK67030.1 hypothetical protein GCM10008179_06680 [Hansschlegelia plantiphila]